MHFLMYLQGPAVYVLSSPCDFCSTFAKMRKFNIA